MSDCREWTNKTWINCSLELVAGLVCLCQGGVAGFLCFGVGLMWW